MSALARLRTAERPATPSLAAFFTLYDVAAAAVFISILAVAALPRFDADFWWHIYTGAHILGSGVPGKDFLSYTAYNHTWIDHEWLSEVIMYVSMTIGGFRLVLSLFALITTGAFLVSFSLMKARGVQPMLGLVLILLGAVSTVATWGPRVQMISLLLAGVFCLFLERYRLTGEGKWLGMMAGIMLLWCNLHGGFAVGLILIVCYLVGGLFDRHGQGMTWSQAIRRQRPLALCLVACFLATFVNPDTYHTALYPLRFVTPNAFTNTIQESLSPNFHLFQLLPFEMLLLTLIVCALVARRRVSWIDVLICATFTHLALQQTRNIDLWCIVVLPIVGFYVQEATTPLAKKLNEINRPLSPARLPLLNWLLLGTLVVAGISFLFRVDSPPQVLAAVRSDAPVPAVNWIKSHPPFGHGFNSYAYGGYLIWATNGTIPVFIDSRADTVYPDSVLKDYLAIYNAAPNWQQLLNHYDIRWVFVERTAPIAAVLSQLSGWRTAHRGQEAVIYERR